MKRCGKGCGCAGEGLERELKLINGTLNRFLKEHFTIEIDSLQQYLHGVKDLLIQLTTQPMAPLLTNVFSKFSNILQPFTSYSYDLSLDALKHETAQLREDNARLARRVGRLKTQLEDYRVKAERAGQLVYMLRANNINVDELYRRGVMGGRGEGWEEAEEEAKRVGVELAGGEWLAGLVQESTVISQYVSTKSRR